MNLSTLQLRLVTGSYSLVKWSRLLESRWGRSVFLHSYFLYKRFLEDSLRGLIRRYPGLVRGGHAIDVGANVGYTACLLAKALDPGFRVYAFEPEDLNFLLLKEMLETFPLRDLVLPMQAAVGETDGTILLAKNESHPGDHRVLIDPAPASDCASVVSVPLRSIDSLVASERLESVSLIKIDVQGYEPAVCEGMERTLAANPRCTVVLEFSPEALAALGFSPDKLLLWFKERGFAACTVHGDGRLSPGPPARLGPNEYTDLLFSRQQLC